jgi:hypothetical protein
VKQAVTIIMLENVFRAIYSAFVAHQIIARHTLKDALGGQKIGGMFLIPKASVQ